MRPFALVALAALLFSPMAAEAQRRWAAPAGAPGVPAAGEPGYGYGYGAAGNPVGAPGVPAAGEPGYGAPGVPAAGAPGYGAAGDGANLGGPVNHRGPR